MSSNVSASVDELKLGTALALSARPDPDNESMDDSHLRIGGLFAGGFQAQEIADHLASISSDAVIAAEVQKHEDALSVRADLSSRADPAIVDAHLRIGGLLAGGPQLQEIASAAAVTTSVTTPGPELQEIASAAAVATSDTTPLPSAVPSWLLPEIARMSQPMAYQIGDHIRAFVVDKCWEGKVVYVIKDDGRDSLYIVRYVEEYDDCEPEIEVEHRKIIGKCMRTVCQCACDMLSNARACVSQDPRCTLPQDADRLTCT